MKKEVSHPSDIGKTDISLMKLVNYNLLFFIPILIALLISFWLGSIFSIFFETSQTIVARIFMFVFTFLIFMLIIPFIRRREKISGIRYSILAFFLVGIGLSLPSALAGNPGFLLGSLCYFAHYLLLTFIFAPEVLGIYSNIKDWFIKGKQLYVMVVYLAIVLLYIFGFGMQYYDMYVHSPDAFTVGFEEELEPTTFIYYSVVTFATIGYGEITPLSTAARFMTSLEIMFGMVINVLFIALLLVYISGTQSNILKREEHKLDRAEESHERQEDEIQEVKSEVKKIKKKEKEVDELLKKTKAKKK